MKHLTKYLIVLGVVLAIAIPVVIIFAAGGSGLPSAPACPSPTPLVAPISATPGGQAALDVYNQAMSDGIKQLTDLRNNFKKQYPTDTFFRDSAFRPDFATYADTSICIAQQLAATQPLQVGGQVPPFDNSKLVAALNSFVTEMTDGRDAVASRNVTDYRKWYANIGDKLQAVNSAFINPSG